MEAANPDNNTVGGLDGLSISIPVVYANTLNSGCQQTVTYIVNFNTDIPDAQQALEDYPFITENTEDFEGLCLESDDLISEIRGTGKMVELFSMIANLQTTTDIDVVSVAGIAYTGTQANMAAIGLEIKNLMMADGRTTVGDLDGITITIPVVFANALNSDCERLVNFNFTFDTSIPDNSLSIVCSPIVKDNDEGLCSASVTFAATVSGVPEYTSLIYKIGNDAITSPHTFPIGTTTVTATATNDCKTVSCSFDVTVVDAEEPVITCSVPGTQNVIMNNACTYLNTGTGWDPTASDICSATTLTYTLSGATNGTGSSLDNVAFNFGATTVTWKAMDIAGNFDECSFTVNVSGVTLSGNVNYYNTANTPLDWAVVKLLEEGTTNEVASATTGSNGAYSFANVCPGNYDVVITTGKPMRSINSTDAGQVNAWYVSRTGTNPNYTYQSIEKVRFLAGDVNGDKNITPADASMIQQYYLTLGTVNNFDNRWEFWKTNDPVTTQPQPGNVIKITIPAGSTGVTQNFYGLVSGDFDLSNRPAVSSGINSMVVKSSRLEYGSVNLLKGEEQAVAVDETIDLPVKAVSAMQVGAISLILDYPGNLVQVENVFLKNDINKPVEFNILDGKLVIGWNSINPISMEAGEPMLTIRMKMIDENQGTPYYFELVADPLNELADGNMIAMNNASLIMDGLLMKGNVTGIDIPARSSAMMMTCYPNPFHDNAKIKYTLPEDGRVHLEVTGVLGNRITILSNQHQTAGEYLTDLDGTNLISGVYHVTLRFTGQNGKEIITTARMIKQ